MKVNEIFNSIEGEGVRSGYLSTFIRLYGCNLNCPYCDSNYACVGNNYEEMTPSDILYKVDNFSCNKVTITGGEPLIHEDICKLLELLTGRGLQVNIETNGSVNLQPFLRFKKSNIIFTMDYKSKTSQMNDKMCLNNINLLDEKDVLKFVVGNIEDLKHTNKIIEEYKPKCNIFISPVFKQMEPKKIVDFMKQNLMDNCRMQLQIHKYIWDPKERGV